MEEIKISRDKKNPTWVWVSDEDVNSHPTDKKRILLDVVDAGCMCVSEGDTTKYINGEYYNLYYWKYFTIIKEPTYRPFKDGNEFIEYCKTRTDMRIIDKNRTSMSTILSISYDYITIADSDCKYDSSILFKTYTWLDGSPIGVKE